MHKAMVVEGWEFHMLNGTLYITREDDPDVQVKLNPEAILELLKYISECNVEDLKQGKQ